MGLTAEYMARLHGISRLRQDEFALRSHQKAWEATQGGRFKNEIVAIEGHDANGVRVLNWPMQRLLLSYSANVYTRLITGLPLSDATGGPA